MASPAAPVLGLFRRLLRLHARVLPPPMRELGNTYVRDEFRRHLRGKTTPEQWREFMAEWERYADMLTAAPGSAEGGGVAAADASGDMPPEVVEQLTPDQKMRLQRLQLEAQRLRADLLDKE